MEIVLLDADGRPLEREQAPERRPKPPRPLRSALLATLVVGVVALYAASLIASFGAARLKADLEHDLRSELAIARVPAAEGKVPDRASGDRADGLVVQVIESWGAVAAASPGVDRTMIAVNGPFDGTVAETKVLEVDGRTEPYRVTWAAVPSATGIGTAIVVVVGLPVAPTERAVDLLRIGLFATAAVVVVATATITWVVARPRAARRTV